MRLVWYSPLPPMPSGIADYSAELLPRVARRADVVVVCPPLRRRRSPPPAHHGIPVLTPERYERERLPGDAPVYHLGNNPWHEFVYEAALARPGVVVFHDFVMHHLIEYRMFQRRRHNESGYRRLMQEEYGEEGLRAHDLRLRGAMTHFEKFVYPLNGHVARAAGHIVVHSWDSAERLRDLAPGIPITLIPHHAGSPPPRSPASIVRRPGPVSASPRRPSWSGTSASSPSRSSRPRSSAASPGWRPTPPTRASSRSAPTTRGGA